MGSDRACSAQCSGWGSLGVGVARCFRLWLTSRPLSLFPCPRKGSSEARWARCSLGRVLLEMLLSAAVWRVFFSPLSLKGYGAERSWAPLPARRLPALRRRCAWGSGGSCAAGAARSGAGPDRTGPRAARAERSGRGAAPPGAGWPYRPSPSAARYLNRAAGVVKGKAAVFWNGLSRPLEYPKGVNFQLECRPALL